MLPKRDLYNFNEWKLSSYQIRARLKNYSRVKKVFNAGAHHGYLVTFLPVGEIRWIPSLMKKEKKNNASIQKHYFNISLQIGRAHV